MSEILSGYIDLSKIDESKIVKGKNGAKYYNIQVVINDEADKYGNIASISQNQSKEEREAKTPKVFIGNLKSVWKGQSTKPSQQNEAFTSNSSSGDLSF